MPENQAPVGVSLADAIAQVRSELERAVKEGQGSTVEFRVGPVGLEFEVGFARTGGVGGGFRLSVLALRGEGRAFVDEHPSAEDRFHTGEQGRRAAIRAATT